ncbi:MAG: ornithine carbamoyltransferase [Methanosarcinales archaeon Met12]|nr:MAG: ornithine carbamoyltransferase [Methanosarcinales archaeon Met12]
MNFISMADLTYDDITDILDMAEELKEKRARGEISDHLKNKSLAMIFEKPSTRTRVSFETAMADLGGHALYLNWQDIQLGRGETIEDSAQAISRYVHGVMVRANAHKTVVQFAKHSKVPVINGLTDIEHPCQSLADLLTIYESKGKFADIKFGWIGDGNNVCNSSILAGALTGMDVVVACPKGYEPNEAVVKKAEEIGGDIKITHDPEGAARDADVLYTDVWVSMGDESKKKIKMRDFQGFRIDEKVVEMAKDDVIVMHCLPANRGEEITADIIDGPHSVIFEQAENRLHAQKALLVKLLG